MELKNKYYKYLDIIRILACMAVLFYHLDILKGGYLAVCSFFVLSGYLSCVSAFKKKEFSIKEYYKNRLLKVYLPFIMVVFITIAVVGFFKSITWLNLKPEATSVLFGFNNFWQLNANLDYFAHHINSPFLHLWYVSILLQFDLLFPIFYNILKKLKEKYSVSFVHFLVLFLAFLSYGIFAKVTLDGNTMNAYYNTFTRLFSLMFGVFIGYFHYSNEPHIPKLLQRENFKKIVFFIYSVLLICLFIFVDAKSNLYILSMLLVSIFTCRMIDYATCISDNENNRSIEFISKISYGIYLVQYPVIFLFQYLDIPPVLKTILILIITVLLAYQLYYILKPKGMFNKGKTVLKVLIGLLVLVGFSRFVIAEDHTAEMKQLEKQLNQNEQVLEEKRKEYELKYQQELENLKKLLDEIESDKGKLEEVVKNLPIVGIGDSVMLGASPSLYAKFSNGYFDAKVSRSAWVANGILKDLDSKKMLGNTILFHLGTNGDCSDSCKKEIMKTCGNRDVFWINVTNDSEVHFNDHINEFSKQYSNLHIIDWYSVSKGHPEYFVADGIHLTTKGREAYAEAVYQAIYDVYLEQYEEKKQEIYNNYNDVVKTRISFYGNDLLLNYFEELHEEYPNDKFILKQNFSFENILNDLKTSIKDKSLNHNIVFAFDNSLKISDSEYEKIMNLCKDYNIYIILMKEETPEIDRDNVTFIPFYEELKKHNNYLMADKIHLTNEGNKALFQILKKYVK